jgi:Lamin Tail Domain
VMLLPWDLDHAFYFATNFSPYGGNAHRVRDLIADARFKRRMATHLHDMCNNGFSNAYLDPWIDHLNAVAGKSYNTNFKNWISARRSFVLSQLATDFPATAFAISTNGGGDFSVAAPTAVLAGTAWIDVHRVRKAGAVAPLELAWTSGSAWQVVVPLGAGANAITLEALDYQGIVIATDTITITNTGPNMPAAAGNIAISEIMYHPADLTAAELGAGFTDADDFEWIELMNISPNVVDLAGAAFTAGITHTFASGSLSPGARLLVVKNPAAFAFRHGPISVAGTYTGSLNNAGDHLVLLDRAGVPILDFSYGDDLPWPPDSDGSGRSLTLVAPQTNPAPGTASNWRVSVSGSGSPGANDALSLAGYPTLLDYAIAQTPSASIESGFATFEWRERLGADEATVTPQFSTNLTAPWQTDPGDGSVLILLSNSSNTDGTRTLRMRAATPANGGATQFFRLQVTGR